MIIPYMMMYSIILMPFGVLIHVIDSLVIITLSLKISTPGSSNLEQEGSMLLPKIGLMITIGYVRHHT